MKCVRAGSRQVGAVEKESRLCVRVVVEMGEAKGVWKLREEPDGCNRYDYEASERAGAKGGDGSRAREEAKWLTWFAGVARVSTSERDRERGDQGRSETRRRRGGGEGATLDGACRRVLRSGGAAEPSRRVQAACSGEQLIPHFHLTHTQTHRHPTHPQISPSRPTRLASTRFERGTNPHTHANAANGPTAQRQNWEFRSSAARQPSSHDTAQLPADSTFLGRGSHSHSGPSPVGGWLGSELRVALRRSSTTTTTSLVLEICNVQRCPAVPRASSPFVIVISVLLAPAEPTATALPKCTFFVGERAGLALFAPTQLQQY